MKKQNLHYLFLILIFIPGCSGKRPSNIGVTNNSLAPCPASPNCVSTFAEDEKHKIEPILYTESVKEARYKLIKVLTSLERVTIITDTDNYLHAEFTSKVMRFVDDVEFLINNEKNIIHMRSASRIGYSDMGVNRKRLEMIRELFKKE